MQNPIRIAICCLSLVHAGPLNFAIADDPRVVRPGDAIVDGSFIVPYSNSWRYSQKTSSGETKLLGRWTDEMSVETINGEEQILRRQSFPTPNGNLTLINRARRSDLSPRSLEMKLDDGKLLQHIDFEESQLSVTLGSQPDPIVLPLDKPVFDWTLYGILLAGFPLEANYSASFPALSPNLQPVLHELRVVDREAIDRPNGTATECWKVEASEGLTFWLSDTAPYILRLRKKLEDGSEKLWEIEADP